MSCELEQGYDKQNCANNGAITAWSFANKENLQGYTLEDNGQEIDTITMVTGKKMFKINLDVESSTAGFTPTRSRENNSAMIALSAMMIIKDDELDSQILWDQLLRGFFVGIAHYANGKNRVFGIENALTIETIEALSGQKFEDLNGGTLNFIGKELSMPPLISDAKAAALLIPTS